MEAILKAVKIPVQLGGGIRDIATIETWLEKGITRLILGTIAVRDPALVREACRRFPGKIAVGIDARAGKVAVEGWAQTSELGVIDLAHQFQDAGVAAIIYTDIDRDGVLKGLNMEGTLALARATAEQCFMPLTVGGGVRTLEDIRRLLLAGADKVSINTAAVTNPDFVAEASRKFGAQCIVVAIDAKRVDENRWEIFTHGGRKQTGLEAIAFARKMVELGSGELLVTSMDRDGTGAGFDIKLMRAIADAVTVPVIASGGVGSLDHLVVGVKEGHASAVLAASIFHFGTYTIAEAKAFMAAADIPVRL